jgi:glycosyltransferase involved in cell wall biosynthesis
MPGAYASFDIVTLPSRVEAMPMCVLEALAAARPVVATSVGDVGQVVLHEKTGLLVDADRTDQLASAITKLLDDDVYATQLGIAGQTLVSAQFSARAMATSYRNVYRMAMTGESVATEPIAL